ncbi:basic helix-loop-helix (bHLH) DNA-binding superfamily protein [Euphorbia peplus]|nr:basic helix-loop-helix (bHLH) DNA-binding superfamily protein [Euphorbia peplus]
MDKVCEELDEAKAEIEKLRVELKCKEKLSEDLKKAHYEQKKQFQQTTEKTERQAEELNEKAEEVSSVRQMCEDLKCSLNEKESIIRQLSSANDKLRVDSDRKCRNLEEEKRELVLALDEANERNIDQEQKINVYMAEIEGLKGLLSASQKKLLEAEKKARAYKELGERDELLLKLEDENRKHVDQLKWKKEQFKHLEEAHVKLRDQLRENKNEWELEKSKLVDEICRLETSLDSQTRMSENLQNQLKMVNQALAHEESKRKYLEVEICEYKTQFEDIFTECQDTKSQLEHLTTQRDKEIAALRHLLGTKETVYKEAEYQARKLEQENQELLASLKELREAQIQEVGNSSALPKLRNKLRNLEQIHRDCSANLSAKEAEWRTRLNKLTGELECYRSSVKNKEETEEMLKIELEDCYNVITRLEVQKEEASVISLVLRSGITEAQLNLRNAEAEMSFHEKERQEKVTHLMRQLEMKDTALYKALQDNQEERQKTEALLKRIESFELVEQRCLMEKELERYKELLQESSKSRLQFKEKALQTEKELRDKIGKLSDALDTANFELATEREKVTSLSDKAASLRIIEEKQQLMHTEVDKYKRMLEESSRCQLQALQTEAELRDKIDELCDALEIANSELETEREKAACLTSKVASFEATEERMQLVQKELEKYKEMLEESSRCQLHIEKEASSMETNFKGILREVNDALDNANAELCEEREKAASLLRKVESFNLIEEQLHLMEKELERYKEMLEESTKSQLCIRKQALQKENDFQKKLKEVSDALERVNSELAAKSCEGHAIEFELWIWESIAQRLRYDLEENQALRKDLEASLLSQVEVGETIKQEKDGLLEILEVKDSRIENLQQQIEFYEQELKKRELEAVKSARMETTMPFESERENFLQTIREKDKILGDLREEIIWLEQESLRREFEVTILAQTGAERTLKHEKDNHIQLVAEKDHKIDELLQLVSSLKEKLNRSLVSLSSELAEKQAEIGFVREAWEKIAAAEILAQLEIEEKKLMIEELENDNYYVQQKLEALEKSLSSSQAFVDELKIEKTNLVGEVMRLSTEKENLMGFIAGLGSRINQFSIEDMQLLGTLERMMQSVGDETGSSLASEDSTEVVKHVEEIMISHPSSTTKKFQSGIEGRLPFRELN